MQRSSPRRTQDSTTIWQCPRLRSRDRALETRGPGDSISIGRATSLHTQHSIRPRMSSGLSHQGSPARNSGRGEPQGPRSRPSATTPARAIRRLFSVAPAECLPSTLPALHAAFLPATVATMLVDAGEEVREVVLHRSGKTLILDVQELFRQKVISLLAGEGLLGPERLRVRRGPRSSSSRRPERGSVPAAAPCPTIASVG